MRLVLQKISSSKACFFGRIYSVEKAAGGTEFCQYLCRNARKNYVWIFDLVKSILKNETYIDNTVHNKQTNIFYEKQEADTQAAGGMVLRFSYSSTGDFFSYAFPYIHILTGQLEYIKKINTI